MANKESKVSKYRVPQGLSLGKHMIADFEGDGVDIIENPGYPGISHWTFINHRNMEKLIKYYLKYRSLEDPEIFKRIREYLKKEDDKKEVKNNGK